MALTLSKQAFPFLILFYLPTASPTPPLLALINCSSAPQSVPFLVTDIAKHINILLVNITTNGTQTSFATSSSFNVEPDRIIQTALRTISRKCLNSNVVTDWRLSGCYVVQYYNTHNYSCSIINATRMSMSLSNQSSSMDGVLYGVECEVCLTVGTEKLENAGGVVSDSRNGEPDDVFVFDEHDRSSPVSTFGFKGKVACVWSVGVVCVVGVVLGAWCLRRKVVNNAKVGIAYAAGATE